MSSNIPIYHHDIGSKYSLQVTLIPVLFYFYLYLCLYLHHIHHFYDLYQFYHLHNFYHLLCYLDYLHNYKQARIPSDLWLKEITSFWNSNIRSCLYIHRYPAPDFVAMVIISSIIFFPLFSQTLFCGQCLL